MWIQRHLAPAAAVILGIFAATFAGFAQTDRRAQTPAKPDARSAAPATREDAYRANNIGVALLEQFKYKEAAEEFQRALKLDPSLAVARVNLSIAFYNAPDLPSALREAKAAVEAAGGSPQAHYMLGLIARAQNRAPDAMAAFRQVLQIDPRDPGANINVGQLHLQQRNYADAISAFRTALAAEPYNVTAVYNLAIALTRAGQREEGSRAMQQFQKLRQAGYGTTIGQNYLEQGRYAEAIASTGAEPELVSAATPDVTFAEATATFMPAAKSKVREAAPSFPAPQGRAPLQPAIKRVYGAGDLNDEARRNLVASLGGGVTLFDYDADGDLDLFEVAPYGQRLYRNDGGKFVDVTETSGLAKADSAAIGTGAVAGDYDNDGRADLFVLRMNGPALYHNEGGGKFSDATGAAQVPSFPYLALSAAFVDVDHDGDLDIFIAGFADMAKAPNAGASNQITFPDDFPGAPNMLLRNNGNGKFTDVTAEAKVTGSNARAVAIVPTDYDNRRDVDLLVVNYNEAPTLFSNLRDGTFRNVAAEVGLNAKARFTCAAAGDVNKDGFTDLFLGKDDGGALLAVSDGKGRFLVGDAPSESGAVGAAQFIDYDDDGLLDVLTFMSNGVGVLRNVGGKWENVTGRAVARDFPGVASVNSTPPAAAPPLRFASGDIDGDGDTDFVARYPAGEIRVGRNDGGNRNRSLRVQLAGKVSNRSGVGAKVEARAGSLKQKFETYSATPAPAPADVIFGLGKRAGVDAVRVLWPAGIVQAETEIPGDKKPSSLGASLTVTEIDRKPSSCPYLYAWNGRAFEFVTDFMGGGEMGYWEAPGVRNHPDPDEYVRIRGDQLKVRDGRLELRVTNELEEVLYVDRLQLIAVAHPSETEVFPNEGMTGPPLPPFRLYRTRGAAPPARATDDHGHDVLARVERLDRQYPDDFTLHRIRGYAEQHTLTLDLGRPSRGRTLLLLTGWTDYAFSSDNVAAHQSKLEMMPPSLQVKDGRGRWRTVVRDVGIPVGRPQTVTVDLTGKFLSPGREVRIVTNMRIYWDQILVDTSGGDSPAEMTRLEAARADLRWRGFSAEVTPDGREPFGYDYDRASPTSPWKVMPGRYTREGDVRELLSLTDDMFVVSRPGDEIALSFDATKLPPLPAGWKRTYLLYADGFSKEMDINSASPDAVAPLPFHAMKGYPYDASQSYPQSRTHRDYLERYNTRVVAAPVPRIETTFAEKARRSEFGARSLKPQ
ncbi:MAG TPA: FG-GAP-like repeat-containing protein [Blastocatellia bacterium]|jgi:tetratricopeptide (TPR) repeat protein|nr:FG-GAP-like repeat-containing protein [Blastocatellia bacterium]